MKIIFVMSLIKVDLEKAKGIKERRRIVGEAENHLGFTIK